MLYKFKCKATGDLIMLGPNGDAFLRAVGREPAPRGIIETRDMPAVLAAIEHAIAADEARRAEAEREALDAGEALPPREGVTPRQRLWPMVEMLRRALAENQPIIWGA